VNTPLIHAGIRGLSGQFTTIMLGIGPYLRCILPKKAPEKPMPPVAGPTAGILASIQAMECIKILIGIVKPLVGRMIIFDGYNMSFENVIIKRSSICPTCRTIKQKIDESPENQL